MSRTDRVATLIQREIAQIIQRQMSSSKVGMVSIVSVDVSPDLRNAKVYYSQIGDYDRTQTQTFLRKSAGFVRGELGKVLHLKTIPKLTFVYDESIERGDRILDQLRSLDASD